MNCILIFVVLTVAAVANGQFSVFCGLANGECLNGGTCLQSGTAYKCVCTESYTGSICNDAFNVPCIEQDPLCGSGFVCINDGSIARCQDTDEEGELCGLNLGVCFNGGLCQSSGNAYKCICPEGTAGNNCENNVATNECSTLNPCSNNGNCVNVQNSGGTVVGFTCFCFAGYIGDRCEFSNVFGVCGLDVGTCLNGGTCVNSGTAYKCKCSNNFVGANCETETTDNPCISNPCENGGTCLNVGDGSNLRFLCSCPMFYLGETCSDYAMTDVCGLQDGLCTNGGTCISSGNSFKCECLGTFVGTFCTDTNPDSPCSSNPCQNDGVCMNVVDNTLSFSCNCINGYIGSTCQTLGNDYCGTNPVTLCSSNKVCTNSGTYYRCCDNDGFNCAIGQDFAEITSNTPCSSSSCYADGQCTSTGSDSYTCTCPSFASGARCEFRQTSGPLNCVESGCGVNEVCVNRGNYNECVCSNQSFCHEHLEPCRSNPCSVGICIYEGGSNYSCKI